MKNLHTYITEARTSKYAVSFIGFKDEEGLPITVEISVPYEYKDEFAKFLEKEQDNTFEHVEGKNIEY